MSTRILLESFTSAPGAGAPWTGRGLGGNGTESSKGRLPPRSRSDPARDDRGGQVVRLERLAHARIDDAARGSALDDVGRADPQHGCSGGETPRLPDEFES